MPGRPTDREGGEGGNGEGNSRANSASDGRGDGASGGTDDDERETADRGFRFTLPPITLPPMFPEDFRFVIPAVRRRTDGVATRTVLGLAVVLDTLDAALALGAASGDPALHWVRVGVGTLLAVVLVGTRGLAYGWEVLAVAGGLAAPTALPTLTALVLLGLRRQ